MPRSSGLIKTTLGIVCLLAWVAGCATVQTTSSTAETEAKQFQPEPGMANIYLCRQSGGFGDTLVANCQLDGQDVGDLAPNTFILLSVAPGLHILRTSGPSNDEEVTCDAVAGNNYFYDVSITWDGPLIRHRHISPMADADGRNAVNSESRAVGVTTSPTTNSE